MLIAFLLCLGLILAFAVVGVYAERKLAAFIQDRLGPTEVGPHGVLQTIADLLKLLQKEDITPQAADKTLFKIAPIVIFTAIFSGFVVIPLTVNVQGSFTEVGIFFLLAIISLDVMGILMAGWGSNNKYSLYGAMRSVAQIVSYEIPMSLAVVCVAITCHTLNLQEMSFQQGIYAHEFSTESQNYLFGLKFIGIEITQIGGFLTWNILRSPALLIAFIIFFTAALAEANRAPFDLPEAESELIGGYHTEYSGFRWALLMLSEYGMMLLISFLGAILFFGSWNTPLPNLGTVALADWTSGMPNTITGIGWGAFWLLSKVFLLIFIQIWVRWTYPRLRVDQLMALCWKYLTPAAIILIFICAVWRLWMI